MSFLCSIGIHKWGKPVKVDLAFNANTVDCKAFCKRCNKKKRWIEIKKG